MKKTNVKRHVRKTKKGKIPVRKHTRKNRSMALSRTLFKKEITPIIYKFNKKYPEYKLSLFGSIKRQGASSHDVDLISDNPLPEKLQEEVFESIQLNTGLKKMDIDFFNKKENSLTQFSYNMDKLSDGGEYAVKGPSRSFTRKLHSNFFNEAEKIRQKEQEQDKEKGMRLLFGWDDI